VDQILLYISYIGIILLIGLLCSILSRKLKIPNLLLLLVVGMILGSIAKNGEALIQFSPVFLASIAIMTLALVVFNSSSKFKFREFDSLSTSALKLSIGFLIFNTLILSTLTYLLFTPNSILLAVIFAIVVSGTDPSSTMIILAGAKTKLFELLKIEAIVNTPLIVLIPFLLIDIMKNVQNKPILEIISSQALPFAQQFVAGIGTGIIIALVFFRFMRKYYSPTLSPLAVITAALLAYVGAEALGGNGVLSVTTAGLIFGNAYYVKHKQKLQKFEEVFSEVLEILVFILIGSIIRIPWKASFILPASLLFIVYLLVRYFSVQILFKKIEYSQKEKLYMTLNTPKGIAVAVVVFTLALKTITGIGTVLDLIFLFMIYSIILSTIVTHFTKFFTKVDIKVDETE